MIKTCKAAMAGAPSCSWLVGLLLMLMLSRAQAQSLRDPTLPPAAAGLAGAVPGGPAAALVPGAMTIIVRDGQPYLVVGTRLYAQGHMLGEARIERIGETEVWLREGGVLRKVPRFAGIQRSAEPRAAPVVPAIAPPASPVPAKVRPKPSPRSRPASASNRELPPNDSKSPP